MLPGIGGPETPPPSQRPTFPRVVTASLMSQELHRRPVATHSQLQYMLVAGHISSLGWMSWEKLKKKKAWRGIPIKHRMELQHWRADHWNVLNGRHSRGKGLGWWWGRLSIFPHCSQIWPLPCKILNMAHKILWSGLCLLSPLSSHTILPLIG